MRVLYSFDAEPGSSELSVTEGEILQLINQDVGEGWWEGINSSGVSGLFPKDYVEIMEDEVSCFTWEKVWRFGVKNCRQSNLGVCRQKLAVTKILKKTFLKLHIFL